MKKEDIIEKIKKHMLFKDVDSKILSDAVDDRETLVTLFKIGEEIFSPKCKEKKLGVILCGEASVYSADGSRAVLLRPLSEGDSFGVSNLFEEKSSFVSVITAKRATSVIFFAQSTVCRLIDSDVSFRMNYIRFLSQRICFLNEKISCFTAGSPERRLSVFLCSQSNQNTFSLNVNANSLSEMLNVGRASLYRAFDKLISDGFITKEGKTITLLDRAALEAHYID